MIINEEEKNSIYDYSQLPMKNNQPSLIAQEEIYDIPTKFENPYFVRNCYFCKKLTANFVVYECHHHLCDKC